MKTSAFIFALVVSPLQVYAQTLPILDMHMHASGADDQGPPLMGMCTPIAMYPAWDPAKASYADVFMQRFKKAPCPDPVWSPMSDQALLDETVAVMNRLNVIGVLSGPVERVDEWSKAAPGRFIRGLGFQIGRDHVSVEQMRRLHESGKLTVLAEVTNQYAGIAPDDPRMEPYWALAEELDMPVGIHIGTGPPGVPYLFAPNYRARLHSALTIEEVLFKHPKLRVYVMHAGYPMIDDMLAVLYTHPQVYVEVGVIVYTQPRKAFYRYLEALVDAGFGNRVMFGSDQMVWPGVIERAIAVINEAPFLSETQKRDILYDNAARFLRLSKEVIAKHHQQ